MPDPCPTAEDLAVFIDTAPEKWPEEMADHVVNCTICWALVDSAWEQEKVDQ